MPARDTAYIFIITTGPVFQPGDYYEEDERAMVENITPNETLDCRGLSCPMPLLKTKKAIKDMKSGQILEVFSSDPGTKNDLPGFAKKAGHEYLGHKDDEGFARLYIKVK